MICPHCGQETPDVGDVCEHCGGALLPEVRPPRLLSQIQGLILPEPVISVGRLHHPDVTLPPALLPERLDVVLPEPEPQAAAEGHVVDLDEEADDGAGQQEGFPPPPPPPPPALQAQPNLTMAIIASAMLALIVAGSLWNVLGNAGAAMRPAVKEAYTFIEILPDDAQVLVAWDYDPATQGEMRLLAQPLLHHLQRRGVKIVSMSLRPFGPDVATDAMAFSARWQALDSRSLGPAPSSLGFIPGDALALRSLALSPVLASSQPSMSAQATGMRQDETVERFDLVIEFSADYASSRHWIEQVAVRSSSRLLVAASGAIAPSLRPYEQSGQIRALLAGYPDALAYESLLNQVGPARAQVTAQTLALFFILGVVLLAALRSIVGRFRS